MGKHLTCLHICHYGHLKFHHEDNFSLRCIKIISFHVLNILMRRYFLYICLSTKLCFVLYLPLLIFVSVNESCLQNYSCNICPVMKSNFPFINWSSARVWGFILHYLVLYYFKLVKRNRNYFMLSVYGNFLAGFIIKLLTGRFFRLTHTSFTHGLSFDGLFLSWVLKIFPTLSCIFFVRTLASCFFFFWF